MEVFSAVQGTRYPVSSLPKPIQEAGALTSLRLRGMEWKLAKTIRQLEKVFEKP
jgi:hypothetical protein